MKEVAFDKSVPIHPFVDFMESWRVNKYLDANRSEKRGVSWNISEVLVAAFIYIHI